MDILIEHENELLPLFNESGSFDKYSNSLDNEILDDHIQSIEGAQPMNANENCDTKLTLESLLKDAEDDFLANNISSEVLNKFIEKSKLIDLSDEVRIIRLMKNLCNFMLSQLSYCICLCVHA
jgi:hypothetical protein